MKTFSTIAKRVLLASSLTLLAACGSNGITDPTSARKSGYLTVSASVNSGPSRSYASPVNVAPVTTPAPISSHSGPGMGNTISSGYNVPAN